jgi:transposase
MGWRVSVSSRRHYNNGCWTRGGHKRGEAEAIDGSGHVYICENRRDVVLGLFAEYARACCCEFESRGDSRISDVLIRSAGFHGGQQEMGKPYSQDLRDRVLDAVGKNGMSRRAAAERFEISESSAIKWMERLERTGSRTAAQMGGYKPRKLDAHRDFLEAARAEKSDITLQALCDRLLAERGVKADTSMMSRFFRRIGVTVKKRPWSRASRIAQT